jgi:hypothetical protein
MCCGKCACTEAKKGKKCLTTYTPESRCLPSKSQWVVADPGIIASYTIPATTEFLSEATLFSKAITKTVCESGCIEVTVLSGTLKILDKPMGANGCELYGEDAPAKFLILSHEFDSINWCSPDGATVRLEALN